MLGRSVIGGNFARYTDPWKLVCLVLPVWNNTMDIAQIIGEFWIQRAQDHYINLMHLFPYWLISNFRNSGLSVLFSNWDKPHCPVLNSS